jgi:bile acid-coenzyme A ligase
MLVDTGYGVVFDLAGTQQPGGPMTAPLQAPIEVLLAASSEPYVRTLTRLANDKPEAPLLTCGDAVVSRREFAARTNQMARAYQALGVGEGDFVSIALPNGIDWFVHFVACWKVGAVPQPMSPRLPLAERQAIVELADPKVIVGVPHQEHPGRECLPAGFTPDTSLSVDDLPEVVSPAWKAPTSGGSTGRPKLIVAGAPAEGSAAASGWFWGFGEDDCQVVAGPLYHNAPITQATAGLLLGQHVVVLPRFDAAQLLDALERHRVTWLQLVPTMMLRLHRLLEEQGERDLSSLRLLWHMASKCPDWLKQAWIDRLGPDGVYELYSGTEMQAITVISGREWLEHRGSVGRAVVGEMAILGEDGQELPPGEIGEIYMRPPGGSSPTYRYIGAEAKSRDGWESLGDLGWKDADGYIYISDRRVDMIVSGGANIYPAEVEATLETHPLVLSAVVVGLPDDDLGARVHALVQTASPVEEQELLAFVGERLVRYKVPRSVEFIDEPLRDDAGKVRRSTMRDEAIERLASRA